MQRAIIFLGGRHDNMVDNVSQRSEAINTREAMLVFVSAGLNVDRARITQAGKGTVEMNISRIENIKGRYLNVPNLDMLSSMILPSAAILCIIFWFSACTTVTAPEFSYPTARRSDLV